MKPKAYKPLKDKKLRHAEYYGMVDIFDELYKRSKDGDNFNNLMNIVQSENNILLAYRNIKRNSGSVTPGVDDITIKDIENLEQTIFVEMVRKRFSNSKTFSPWRITSHRIPAPFHVPAAFLR